MEHIRHPFEVEGLEYYPTSLEGHTQAITERIASSHPVFTAADGKRYPITVQFASENEFVLDEGENNRNKDIAKIIEQDAAIRKNLTSVGMDSERALAQVAEFTPRDCAMFDIHHVLLGKAEFNFGQDHHGRGYYDAVSSNKSGRRATAEIRLQPQEALQFLKNHNELLETCERIFNKYDALSGNTGNHLNFSFWIPNDGTYSRFKDALSEDGKSVNLFVLAKHDEHTFQFIKKSLAGIVSVFNETGFIRDHSAEHNIHYDVGASRANAFRICKNRCEYRCGRGVDECMPNIALSVIKGVELAASEHAGLMPPVEEKIGCHVTFKDEVLKNPDSRHFTRRMFEGSQLIAQPGGSYNFSPNTYYYTAGPGNEVDQEMFAGSPAVFGGSGGSFFNKTIQSIFNKVTVKDGKIDASKAIKWMQNQNRSAIPKESIEAFKACVEDIASVETYRTWGMEQSPMPVSERDWMQDYKKTLRSPVVEFVYGDHTADIIGAVSGVFFSDKVCAHDYQSAAEATKELSQYRNYFISIFKAAPRNIRASIAESIKKGLAGLTLNKNSELKKGALEEFESKAIERLDISDKDFKSKLYKLIAPATKGHDGWLSDDVKSEMTTETFFLGKLPGVVDAALNDVGFSIGRHSA